VILVFLLEFKNSTKNSFLIKDKLYKITLALCFIHSLTFSQVLTLSTLDVDSYKENTKHDVWLKITENALGKEITIPVIIHKGSKGGPTLGITAAIHGDEINGVSIIHSLISQIDITRLKGTIIAYPILNPDGFQLHQREDLNQEDLNRIFPGKEFGTESEQYVYHLTKKVLLNLDLLIDIHTASHGRVNTMYARADLSNDTLSKIASLLAPDIILDSKEASAGILSSSSKTLRQEATDRGIKCITLEAGNPQVTQSDMVTRGSEGLLKIMSFLNMHPNKNPASNFKPVFCKKSYWIYTNKGGILEVIANLNQVLKKGELIATQKDLFGKVVKQYFSPEAGIVIGKSTNPVASSGSRILHLGILR
jgi:uncharacterized protein